MPEPARSHQYSFTIYHVPTVDELIGELQRVATVMGGAAKCRIKSTDDQRDGHSISVTVSGPT